MWDHSPSQPAPARPPARPLPVVVGKDIKIKKFPSFYRTVACWISAARPVWSKNEKNRVSSRRDLKPVCTVSRSSVYTGTGTVVYDMKCRFALRAKSGAFGALCVVGTWVPGSARFASQDRRLRRAIVPYRTGTGNQISNTHPVITDGQRDGESEQEICPGLLLLTS